MKRTQMADSPVLVDHIKDAGEVGLTSDVRIQESEEARHFGREGRPDQVKI